MSGHSPPLTFESPEPSPGFCGFRVGVSAGVVIGYYLFIYFQPSDFKIPSDGFQVLSKLQILDLSDNAAMYPEFPAFSCLLQLQEHELYLRRMQLHEIPLDLLRLQDLRILDLSENALISLPKEFKNFVFLTELDLNSGGFSGFKKTIKSYMEITLLFHLAEDGVAIGGDWQGLVAYINLGCYYVFGLPFGFVLGYVVHWGVEGTWAGMLCGTAAQTLILLGIVWKTN